MIDSVDENQLEIVRDSIAKKFDEENIKFDKEMIKAASQTSVVSGGKYEH